MSKQEIQKAPGAHSSVVSGLIPMLQPRAFSQPLDEIESAANSQPILQAKNNGTLLGHSLKHSLGRMNLRSPSYLPIQPKLTIGQVNDPYEQEADQMAAQVVARLHAPPVQRSSEPEEEEELQMKPVANSIQREPEEEEELQMKPVANSIQRELEEEEELQMKPVANSIQRELEEEEELQMKPLQRRLDPGGMVASADLESSINRSRGGGQGLSDSIRQPMEQAFGANFSNVRIHTDSQSDQLNRSINAQAFTTKNDIYFSNGKYNPGSKSGQELLAHELTHVVQQGGSTVQRTPQKPLSRLTTSRSVGNNAIQRVIRGIDPVPSYATGTDKSLLYGMTWQRHKTLHRLNQQNAALAAPQPLRTIDEYNRAAGINEVMTRNKCAYNIFLIRETLQANLSDSANVIANWGLNAPQLAANSDLQEWIMMLAQNRQSIGLEDLGDTARSTGFFGSSTPKGLKKITSKGRFTKNTTKALSAALTPAEIHQWLAPNGTSVGARAAYDDPNLEEQKKLAIDDWIYKAFFRRTSKLGIDFVTQRLNARVHFNTASEINYQGFSRPDNLRADGVIKETKNATKENRAITLSEYKHVKKRMKKRGAGRIRKDQVNFYSEF
jgi:Domain of unknown function (DUF4157)